MKVVRIIARLNVGGPARHVVWLSDRLRRHGFDTTLIAGSVPKGEDDMSFFAAEHGIVPTYIEEMSRELSRKDIVSLWKIYLHLRRIRPDIVHTHTAKAGTLGRIAAFLYKWATPGTLIGRRRKVRVVHTFHGHVFHSYYSQKKTAMFKMIERILARIATDRIVVISDQQFREISGEVGIGHPQQFRVIPLGLDLTKLIAASRDATLRHDLDIPISASIVLFVGRLTEIKDIPLLLDVFSLADEYLHLAIAGEGNLRDSLEQRAHGKRNIHFLGGRQDIVELYAGADIVALSSLNEGTPLSLIEAMAAGRPVISTVVGGVIDLLGLKVEEHEGFNVHERGVGVTSRQPDAYLKGLIYLAKNERLRESLGEAGREFVRSNYSIDRLEKDIVSLYRELVPADN
jgi:glycosyltransferase involved in cell wall biosynthesis